jgi:hypothetical protein
MKTDAILEMLKKFGLRHGEKVAMGVFSLVCVLCLVGAWAHKTIEMTPKELTDAASAAETNLNRHQKIEDILAKLDEAKLIDPGFEKKVEDAKTAPLDASVYAFKGPSWVSLEPGAGFIRTMPELIAPTDLLATANRGAILMYAINEEGDIETEPDAPHKIGKRKHRRTGGMMGGMMGGMGGMGGGGASKKSRKGAGKEAVQRRNQQLADEKNIALAKRLNITVEELVAKQEEETKGKDAPAKEITKGYRCVAIVGKLNHKELVRNYVRALKDPNAAPHYVRLHVQRQELDDDDKWTDWHDIDREKCEDIIKSALEKEHDLTPENVRLTGLVDDLPFFKAGLWQSVEVADLVPDSKKVRAEAPKTKTGGEEGGMGGMMGMLSGGKEGYGRMMGGMMAGGGGGDDSGRGGRGRGMMGGMMGSGGMMGMAGALGGRAGGSGGPADTEFARSNADEVMVRALDFTVEADAVYRYRVCIVVRNPNYGWETVAPGEDTTSEEKEGPWSKPSDMVSIPDDVTTYAVRLAPPGNKDKITFQVARWNPDDGVTIVKNYDVEPGEVIGDRSSGLVPGPLGKDPVAKPVDYTSRQILLDAVGGSKLAGSEGEKVRIELPAQALVMRSDGALMLRDEAHDKSDPEMGIMKMIYTAAIEEAKAGKKRASSTMEGGRGGGGGGMSRGSN